MSQSRFLFEGTSGVETTPTSWFLNLLPFRVLAQRPKTEQATLTPTRKEGNVNIARCRMENQSQFAHRTCKVCYVWGCSFDTLTMRVILLNKRIDTSNGDQVIVLQRIWFIRQLRIRVDSVSRRRLFMRILKRKRTSMLCVVWHPFLI